MRRRRLALTLGALLLVSCSRGDSPEEPAWGKQPCAHCKMVLSDKEFGAELVTTDGDRLFFDDVGCMVLSLEQDGTQARHMWVHDAETGKWVDGTSAHFAKANSPMDFGFAARSSGQVSWSEVRGQVLAKKRQP